MKSISAHLAQLRQDYQMSALEVQDVGDNPVSFFEKWYQQATDADEKEPNAMTLATADAAGQPSARIVLLKGLEEEGFVFFTNYESRKGQAIEANNHAALLFFWQTLQRQVRIEGKVSQLSEAASAAYFHSRPIGSQLGAIASPQSQKIQDRAWLESELEKVATSYEGKTIPKPSYWGGYILRPEKIEFWQGRSSRLHDRILFEKNNNKPSWAISRLAP